MRRLGALCRESTRLSCFRCACAARRSRRVRQRTRPPTRTQLLRPACVRRYSVEGVRHLWRLLHRYGDSYILLAPGDIKEDAGGCRGNFDDWDSGVEDQG